MKTVIEEIIEIINNRSLVGLRTEFDDEKKEFWIEKEKQRCIDFGLHLENMPPINKYSVHPPTGSGGSTGIYEKTIEQLYNEWWNRNDRIRF